jgi:hypothetical protein
MVAVALALLVTACDPGTGIRIENHTDALLTVCFTRQTVPPALDSQFCDVQQAHKTVTWSTICTPEDFKWAVIGIENREIYRTRATCGEWEKSGAWVSVVLENGQYMVRDSLAEDYEVP